MAIGAKARVLLAVLLLVAAACGGSDGDQASPIQKVNSQQGAAIIADEGSQLTLIDVRTPSEFAAGHLEGAVNMDLEGGQFSHDIASLSKDAHYMVYCHTGRRSALAAQAMADAGFRHIVDLGGIVDWQAAGLPVVTD